MNITKTEQDLKNNNIPKIFVEVSNKEKAMEILMKRGYKVNQENTKLCVKCDNLTPARLCKELVLLGFDINYLAQAQNLYSI